MVMKKMAMAIIAMMSTCSDYLAMAMMMLEMMSEMNSWP